MFTTRLTSIHKRMDLWVRIGRPQNIRKSLGIIVLVSHKYQVSLNDALLSIGGVSLAYMIVTTMNNVADIKTDRFNNRKENPLLNIKHYKNEAFTALLLFSIIFGVCLIFIPGTNPKILLLLFVFLGWAYSNRSISIQSHGILATALLAYCYVGIPLTIVSSYTTINLFVPKVVGLCLLAGSMLLAKDYKDIKGDALVGKRTPFVRYGHTNVAIIAITLYILATVLFVGVTKTSLILYSLMFAFGVCVVAVHITRSKPSIFRAIAPLLFLGLVYVAI